MRIPLFILAAIFTFNVCAKEQLLEESSIEYKTNTHDAGRKMYMEGTLPSGELMSAEIQGDIRITGEQVICGACHRRSGMGSSEGQQVVPAVTGKILFSPLKLPASKPPATPVLRRAYNRETLKQAIRDGIDANGEVLDPIMPRYPLDDDSLDRLIDYLDTLSVKHSPGVDERDIHFATIFSDSTDQVKKQALLDVMRKYFEQKNVETRYESKRAENAPWHKEWLFKPYRKWVLHEWELKGSRESWPMQLEDFYKKSPVFAILSGIVPGSWEPIHHFCEKSHIPCLFPTTDLPVISEHDFYPMYMNRGMTLEGEGVAAHIVNEGMAGLNILQIFNKDDDRAKTAADGLRSALKDSKIEISNYQLGSKLEVHNTLALLARDSIVVFWGDQAQLKNLLPLIDNGKYAKRIYLSTSLYGIDGNDLPDHLTKSIYFIHPQEMPSKLTRLLARSTGWFKAKRIYEPEAKRVQANAYFSLKVAGNALKNIRGYFFREYFIERIEHLIDNAPYTSVYPRISLAPGQRFVSKGFYIVKLSQKNTNSLESTTKWSAP